MKKINIVITMDAEPCKEPGSSIPSLATSGPTNYKDSARFIEAYAARAAEYGWPVTFFIHPETAEAHPEVFLELQKQGACLGLHIHPYKLKNTRCFNHFGSMSADQQRVIIAEASARWETAIGRRPEYFRPGTFSANDATFAVLDSMGFKGGSISCPGRLYPDLYAVWAGAPLDPHRGNAHFRLLPGSLDFVNIPLTVDTSRWERTDSGNYFHYDMRPDYLEADYTQRARNIVAQLQERAPEEPVIVLVTHNDNDFTDSENRVCHNYIRSMRAIYDACNEVGIEAAGTTVETLCTRIAARTDKRGPEFVIGDATIQGGTT